MKTKNEYTYDRVSSSEVESEEDDDVHDEYHGCYERWTPRFIDFSYRSIVLSGIIFMVFSVFGLSVSHSRSDSSSSMRAQAAAPTPSPRTLPHRRTYPPTPVDPCHDLVHPQISFLYKERKSELSYDLVHYISIDNYQDYPDELFSAAPNTPKPRKSCDAGEEVSYVTIQIMKIHCGDERLLVEYCEPLSQAPKVVSFEATAPEQVRVNFVCANEGRTYRSNVIEIP